MTAPGTVKQSCDNLPTVICLIQEGEEPTMNSLPHREQSVYGARFEVLTTVFFKFKEFWDVPHAVFIFRVLSVLLELLDPEIGGIRIFRNVGNYQFMQSNI